MENKYNLSYLKSCDQVWEDMPTCEGGRFCAACKNVIQAYESLFGVLGAYLIDFFQFANFFNQLVHVGSGKKSVRLF